ncbi:unnamed protein product [Oreochromis niloticus]|nr:unnamed protein product [Mustela putorius furo]
MDVSVLREEYRSSRERRRRHSQVLLFRTVSEELSEAVAIVPAPQGLTLPWPPPVIFDPDPWHVHLDLHRRSCPETSSRRSGSSSSEVGSLRHESRYRKLSAPPSSSSESPPCCSSSATREEEDPDPPSFKGSRGDLAFPESSTPITTSLQQDQQENRSTQKETSNSVLEGRSSRTLRFTRQQSVGGGSLTLPGLLPVPQQEDAEDL